MNTCPTSSCDGLCLFPFARTREADFLAVYGTDDYDRSSYPQRHHSAGLPRFLNQDEIVARRKARAWLATQPDRCLVRLSVDRTNEMHVQRMLCNKAQMADSLDTVAPHEAVVNIGMVDAMLAFAPRVETLETAFKRRVETWTNWPEWSGDWSEVSR